MPKAKARMEHMDMNVSHGYVLILLQSHFAPFILKTLSLTK